jgi:2,5-diketo-D-gluconate reductase B
MQVVEARGLKIPALGLGTWNLRGEECQRCVAHALELGYRHIDTAAAYDNEQDIGAAMSASKVDRRDIFLVTKVGRDNMSADRLRRSAENSLRFLRADYLDLLLVHWPSPAVSLTETITALLELRSCGKVLNIGVSNFPTRLLGLAMEMSGDSLLTNQVEYHPFLFQEAVHKYLQAKDMILTAYCPLARGKVVEDPVISAIAAKHGRSPAQVTLRWLLDQDRVAAIRKAATAQHRCVNLQIFDFSLDDVDRRKIDALRGAYRIADYSWSPNWDPL